MYYTCPDRKDCVMRHENGNCLPVGGFCTAVNDAVCDAVQQAYDKGYKAGYFACQADSLYDSSPIGGFHGLED